MNQLLRNVVLGLSIGAPAGLAICIVAAAPLADAKPAAKSASPVRMPAKKHGLSKDQLQRLPKARRIRKPKKAYDMYECPERASIEVRLDTADADATFTESSNVVVFANAVFSELNVYKSGDKYIMNCFYQASTKGITFYSDKLRTLPGDKECFSVGSTAMAGCYK